MRKPQRECLMTRLCVPLTGETVDEMIGLIRQAGDAKAEMVELRVDFLDDLSVETASLESQEELVRRNRVRRRRLAGGDSRMALPGAGRGSGRRGIAPSLSRSRRRGGRIRADEILG